MSVASTSKGRHFKFEKPAFGVYLTGAFGAQKAFYVKGHKSSAANNLVRVDDNTRSLAGGARTMDVTCKQTANVLTGTNTALRASGENGVASMTGTVQGFDARAANREASSSGTIMGATLQALAKGKTIGTIRGVEVISDNTEGTGTLTTQVGARIRVIGAGVVTNGPWGVQIVNDSESALAAAKPLKAFIRCESATTTTVNSCIIDATDCRLTGAALFSVSLTAKDAVLIYFKDFDGTAHAVVVQDSDNTLKVR
jgi:hypothetical protein